MFSKKCPKCKSKIKKEFDFCPTCGLNQKTKEDADDYGLLGRNDFAEESEEFLSFGDSFIDKIFNNTLKLLEKQMKNLHNELNQPPRYNPQKMPNNLHVQFFVNGKRIAPEQQCFHKHRQKSENIPSISPEKLNKLSKLPRVEPLSKMKRLSGKIIYELEVPGVNNINDILINQLENSIEIKALSDDKIYSKTLNIKLPIIRYGLNKDSLILEFQGR